MFEFNRPRKVILSCSSDDDECRAIMSFGPEDRLAFCCPGLSNEWTPIGHLFHENDRINEEFFIAYNDKTRVPRFYEDFVYSTRRNQLFCATKFDNFESWDLADLDNPKMNWKTADDDMDFDEDNYPWSGSYYKFWLKRDFCNSFKYLVFAEQSGRLFLVRRNVMKKIGTSKKMGAFWYYRDGDGPYQTIGFDVHELIVEHPKERGELRYMDGSLDGMSFFIGSAGHGFVVEDQQNGVEPNSIYFTDPKELTTDPWNKAYLGLHGGHDVGIFNYQQRTFSPCYYSCDLRNIKRIDPAPTWFSPSPP